MSQFVVDDSEVIIGHQEEIAGAMEREGSLQNRGEKESWLADTEPYRGARPRMRDFDRMVDEELGPGPPQERWRIVVIHLRWC